MPLGGQVREGIVRPINSRHLKISLWIFRTRHGHDDQAHMQGPVYDGSSKSPQTSTSQLPKAERVSTNPTEIKVLQH